MRKITYAVVFVITALACIWAYRFYQGAFGSGWGKTNTASRLIHDDLAGGRVVRKAIAYGADILPFIVSESKDFSALGPMNSFRVAEVLGAVSGEDCERILQDLYSRDYQPYARLAGAIGLAQHGMLPVPENNESFLAQAIQNHEGGYEDLAVIALAKSRNMGTILLIERALESPRGNTQSQAFRALIFLGYKDAVTLVLDKVDPKQYGDRSHPLGRVLQQVTGQDFGADSQAWQRWWVAVREQWEIPEQFMGNNEWLMEQWVKLGED